MFYVLQNESTAALRRVPILLTDAATGTTAQTGVATTNIFPYVNINGGAFAGGAGTIGEAGYGQYYYEMDPTEIGTLGLAGIHITAVGCRDYDAIAQIAALNVYSAGGSGISAYDVWSFDYLNAPGGVVVNSAAERLEETRTETYNNASSIGAVPLNVWEYDISGVTTPALSGTQLNTAATGGAGISAYDVWNFVLSDTNTAEQDLVSAASGGAGITAGDVWSYVDRTITGGTATTVANPVLVAPASMTGIAGTVWDFSITGFGQTGSAAEYSTQTNFTVGNIETYVANQTPQDVWTYAGIEGRTITGGLADTVTTLTNPANVTTGSMTGIAGTVWTYGTRTLTSGGGITAGEVADAVWNATVASYSTNGTYGLNVLRADAANKVGDVTLYSSGGVNGVDADIHRIQNDTAAATALKDVLTGIGGSITANITGNITGNLSGSVGSVTAPVDVTTGSMTGIGGTVWSVATRTITGGTITTVSDKTGYSLSGTQSFNLTGNITGNLSGSVGSVTNAVVISPATQASIANSVWLTDVSGYAAPSAGEDLATASAGGISPIDIWTYGTRTITGGIADTVTTVTNGVTVTTNNDKTGYALSGAGVSAVQSGLSTLTQAQVGTEVDSSLADVGLTTTVTGRIDATVSSRLASASYTAPPTTAAIAGTVWTYGSRTLTSGGGITAGDVWSYDISGITATGTAGKQLNDASASGSVVTIVNGPYKLTSIAEGVDGRIDILQGSVQTINLNLVNGFGQPFNVTGYTLSVDVYDVASSLVESYVPTVNYAGGGNISFDIDGAVTDVIGTYSCVVSLTDGDVIQVGPITILVRPL